MRAPRPEGLRDTLRLIDGFARGNRRALIAIAVIGTAGGLAEAAVLVVIARLAFSLASGETDASINLGPLNGLSLPTSTLIALAFSLVVVRALLQVAGGRLASIAPARVARNVRLRLTRAYFRASWSLQSAERTGRLQEIASKYTSAASSATMQFSNAIIAFTSLVTFLVTALAVSPVAAVVVAVTALALGLLLRPLRTAIRSASRANARANMALSTDVTESANHVLEVRIFGVEKAVGARIADGIIEVARLDVRTAFLSQLGPIVFQSAAMVLMVGVIAVLYATDVSNLSAVGGVVLIMIRSLTYGQQLVLSYQSAHGAAPFLEILRDELDRYDVAAVKDRGEPVLEIGELAFEHVSFEYVPDTPVLRDISFRVSRGEIVGIVGPSGSGKSTLVQLLLRLRDPSSGSVLADGRDVRELSLDEWYQRVSFVPQEPALYAASVADNIRFYRDSVDQDTIERAAKLANLHDEVMSWPRGYDTHVGERGGQFSGGQRQRLCIARALVEEPDVLVFDEPTSSLDARSEILIRETMALLAPRTTVFVIAHRLSTLSICDRIMVLLNGELQAFDEPTHLEATSHFYREALEISGLR